MDNVGKTGGAGLCGWFHSKHVPDPRQHTDLEGGKMPICSERDDPLPPEAVLCLREGAPEPS